MGNCFGGSPGNRQVAKGLSQIQSSSNNISHIENRDSPLQQINQGQDYKVLATVTVHVHCTSKTALKGDAAATQQFDFVPELIKSVTTQHNNWLPMKYNHETLQYVPLPSNSHEYRTIEWRFKSTNKSFFKVCGIERIQNPYLYAVYMLKREELISRYGNTKEVFLFHGTTKENIESICNENFNWRLNGKGNGHIYGRGVCFSYISYYATHYCDQDSAIKVMLLAKVLISRTCVGEHDMILPPDGFDTTAKENNHVTVKYDDNEFYPAYKIYYTERSKMSHLQ